MTIGIVCFRRDLRLLDNPALAAAAAAHPIVACVYIHAPDEEKPWQPGAASRWWLHHSLQALDADLRKRGSKLHILCGPTTGTLVALCRRLGADSVYWNRRYEPVIVKRDRRVERALEQAGVALNQYNAGLLFEPWEVETGAGGPYKVFTPFWRNARARLSARPPQPAPTRLKAPATKLGVKLGRLKLLPTIGWDAEFSDFWQAGEAGASDALDQFSSHALAGYPVDRDRPDHEGTSRLSPHLHFGEIGPRQIVWELLGGGRHGRSKVQRAQAEPFLRQLGWREFSYHLMHHFPFSTDANLNAQFDRFPWARQNRVRMQRWQSGRTGIPIVDAGLRQLWTSGWMHNRVRLLVASFLTKNMRQHWLGGARWFWDTLVDADLANNTQGWQWTAGSGADAAPYFRIFNPVTQGKRFDPDGSYVRRWVPELRALPGAAIHEPWKLAGALDRSGYPMPMVELDVSRTQALDGYRKMRALTRSAAVRSGKK